MDVPVVIEVRVVAGGRRYPPGIRRPEHEVDRLVDLVHRFRCGQGLSYRAIAARLLKQGYRVSRGSVQNYHRRYWCEKCKDEAP
jgi:hypothetical protein